MCMPPCTCRRKYTCEYRLDRLLLILQEIRRSENQAQGLRLVQTPSAIAPESLLWDGSRLGRSSRNSDNFHGSLGQTPCRALHFLNSSINALDPWEVVTSVSERLIACSDDTS